MVPDGEYTDEWSHYDNQFDVANEKSTAEYSASVDIFREGAPTSDSAPGDPPVDGAPGSDEPAE